MIYATVSLVANTIGSIALFFLFRAYGLMPHLGIAVATTLGGWLNAGLLYATLVKRGYFVADQRLRRTLPRIVPVERGDGRRALGRWRMRSAGASAPPLRRSCASRRSPCLVGSGLAVYVLAVFATGALDVRQLRSFLKHRTPPAPDLSRKTRSCAPRPATP